ncbi:MAG: ATP-dependent sacrificial sulfur transferase LarE [Kiritimatiellia bacterium]
MTIEAKTLAPARGTAADGRNGPSLSGGVDSTLLAALAKEILGERVLLVTAVSPIRSSQECREAVSLATMLGLRHRTIQLNELQMPGFAENPPEHCYLCKRELFRHLTRIAEEEGLPVVANGSNADDSEDERPGRRTAREAGIRSALEEVGLRKEEIRVLSRERGLPTADKPPQTCLATRFPYGTRITEEGLRAVDTVETYLRELGLAQHRARFHGKLVRMEVDPSQIEPVAALPVHRRVCECAHTAGFRYVALDLDGYRAGNMNEPCQEQASVNAMQGLE